MLFRLDFGCMVHSFKRCSGKRKICPVLVPAVTGCMREWTWWKTGRGRDGPGWLEPGSGPPTAGHAPLPASFPDNSTIFHLHSTQPSPELTLLHMGSPSAFSFPVPCLCPQGGPQHHRLGKFRVCQCEFQVTVYMNQQHSSKVYWGFLKTTSCWGDQDGTWTIFP